MPTHRFRHNPPTSMLSACALAAALWSGTAQAQTTSFELLYVSDYFQAGVNPPTVTLFNEGYAFALPPGGPITDVFVATPIAEQTELFDISGFFQNRITIEPTRGALMAAMPAGTYTFSWNDDGNALQQEISQPFGLGLWPDQIPAFTPITWTNVQNMNPALPYTFVVNSFIPSPLSDFNSGGLFINLVGPTGEYGPLVYSQIGGGEFATLTSRVLPANTLAGSTTYYATWIFSHEVNSPDYMGPGFADSEFRASTRMVFTTGPGGAVCDSVDFNGDTFSPDSADLDDFIAVLAGGPSACSNFPSCGDIDFNNDGFSPDALDLDAFISRLGGGPCLQ